jgi:uncharacterized damage-inducible protein DinB
MIPMDVKELYINFARYNQWANERIYTVCQQLDSDSYYQDRRAFFGSIHGTLNHILLADRVWMSRFTGEAYEVTSLRDELYPTFELLKSARQSEDTRILAYVTDLTSEALALELSYSNSTGQQYNQPLWQCLVHLFNHQTHHRGQVHQMLGEADMKTPVLDLVVMLRDRP